MRIGELALRTGASTRALRHYEARALIASSRLENGYRDYAPAMVQRVRWIRELIECGFSTRQIHGLLQHLEEEDVQVLEMRFFEKRPFKEIAEIRDSNESAVKMKVYRLLGKLKGIMDRK